MTGPLATSKESRIHVNRLHFPFRYSNEKLLTGLLCDPIIRLSIVEVLPSVLARSLPWSAGTISYVCISSSPVDIPYAMFSPLDLLHLTYVQKRHCK